MSFPKFAKGWGARKMPGTMNKLEQRYADHLGLRQRAGEVAWFKYEAVTLKLAPDLRYTPDFAVMLADGTLELHECKGFFAEHNKVKTKAAAAMFPFRFLLVEGKAKRAGGGWEFTAIGEQADGTAATAAGETP